MHKNHLPKVQRRSHVSIVGLKVSYPAACPAGGAGRAFGVWARHKRHDIGPFFSVSMLKSTTTNMSEIILCDLNYVVHCNGNNECVNACKGLCDVVKNSAVSLTDSQWAYCGGKQMCENAKKC